MTVLSKPKGGQGEGRENPSSGPQNRTTTKGQAHWDNLERGRSQMREIETRLQVAAEEIDWAEEVEKVQAAENGSQKTQAGLAQDQEEKWYGDNMDLKNQEGKVGCRVLTINTNKQSVIYDEGVMNFERDLDYIIDMGVDIAIIHEPGNTQKIGPTLRGRFMAISVTAVAGFPDPPPPRVLLTRRFG